MSDAIQLWWAQQQQQAKAQIQDQAQAQAQSQAQAEAQAQAQRARARAQVLARIEAKAEILAQKYLNEQQLQQAESPNAASPAPQQAAAHRQAVSPVKHGETTQTRQQPAVVTAEVVPVAKHRPAEPAPTAAIARSEPVTAAVETAPAAVASENAGDERRSASPALASEAGSAGADESEHEDASVDAEEAGEESRERNVSHVRDKVLVLAEYQRLMIQDEGATPVKFCPEDHDDYDMATIEHTLIYPSDGKVSIPFPPSELMDPLVPGMVPGSRRWRFEAFLTAEDEAKLISKIINMLLEEKFHLEECSISLLPGLGRERYVQIQFNLLVDYACAATMRFPWNGRPMELVSSVAPLRKRSTVLKICNISGPTEEIIDNISSAIGDFVSIDNIWRLDRVVYINKNQSTITVKGSTLLILATFREHPAVGWYGPQDLPGFVSTRWSTHALHFIGRTNRCGCCLPERNTPLNYVASTDNAVVQRKRARDDAASTPQPVQKKHKKDDKGKKQVDQPES